MPVIIGGDKFVTVSKELAEVFQAGDKLAVAAATGELLHIPLEESDIATTAVSKALDAFDKMGAVNDEQIGAFFEHFATALEDDGVWGKVQKRNEEDVASAKARGRSTTRLEASDTLRNGMTEGLRGWIEAPSRRGQIMETVQNDGFRVELVGAALGVVAFVFEGRPNVLADACGVLRSGNTVVFRIGSDALQTAKAIMDYALNPALEKAGLPAGAATLVESSAHAAGWAMFSDSRLALAVARGSGRAVDTLGSLARSAGVATSLHGTGGAWIVGSGNADPEVFENAVADSLDRKVCNTLNTCCIEKAAASNLVPAFLKGMARSGKRRLANFKLHIVEGAENYVPSDMFEAVVAIGRAEGLVDEAQAEMIDRDQVGNEWEWEDSPEVTLVIVESIDEAVELFNEYSPQFLGSLISSDSEEQKQFYNTLNAPFIGDYFTRWVDGQFALKKPELGLSNWENGRLFGRGSILAGDSVFTVRTRYVKE